MSLLTRRGILTGLGAALAAPAIVHAANLMPIRGIVMSIDDFYPRPPIPARAYYYSGGWAVWMAADGQMYAYDYNGSMSDFNRHARNPGNLLLLRPLESSDVAQAS